MVNKVNGASPYIWDLLWQIDTLAEGQSPSLDGALLINVFDLLTEVCLGADKTNQAVLDLQRNVCTLLDGLGDGARCVDNESRSTKRPETLVQLPVDKLLNRTGFNVRLGRVG